VQGLAWLSRNILQKSTDIVHLANVICDSRTPSTGVGSYGSYSSHTQWTPSREEQSFAKEIQSRAAKEAIEMLEARYTPVLEMQGIECVMDVLPLKLHKSAGGIAETIVHAAIDMGADLVVLCSHGPGARTDFGSVARWCEENSPIPTMLLPPSILTQSNPPTIIQMGASNSVLVGAADDLDGLKRCFDYAVTDHTRPGDGMYVVHAIDGQEKGEDELMQLRKDLVANVLKWQSESPCSHAATLNVAVQLVLAAAASDSSSSSDEELSPDLSPAGADIVEMAARMNVRTVILAHHGKNMMREMLYKPLTLHCINNCQSPLIVLREEKKEGTMGY
jgi:nucleotide-binding universal stress UspA family protein